MATYYVDYEGGNDSNDGLSFAQRKKTIDSANALSLPGDTIRLMGSPAPTSLGQNATWSGKVIGALSLNGTTNIAWSGGISVNRTQVAAGCSFSSWINPTDRAATYGITSLLITTTSFGVSIWLDTNGKVNATFDGGSTSLISNSAIATGVWSHIVVTYNGTVCQIYINNVLDNSGALTLGASALSFVSVGARHTTADFFKGLIDTTLHCIFVAQPADVAVFWNNGLGASAKTIKSLGYTSTQIFSGWDFDDSRFSSGGVLLTGQVDIFGSNNIAGGLASPYTRDGKTESYYLASAETALPVILTTPVTQFIADGRTNWTASANVTCTTNSTNWKMIRSQQIAVAAGFATGLAAYFPTGALDLSGYQQVSFWFRSSTITTAKNLSLRLCSDAVGAVTVNQINIPDFSGTTSNSWIPVTVDTGGNLGNNINSIALYVDTDNGAVTVILDCIIACKASSSPDSLTLSSLLGNSDSTEAGGLDTYTWYGIQSINGINVMLDASVAANGGVTRGWSGRPFAITSSTNTSPIQITATNHGLVTGDVIELRGHYIGGATLSNANGYNLSVTRIDANTFSIDGTTGNGVGSGGAFWVRSMIRTTYKRETIKTNLTNSSSNNVQALTVSGTLGNPIIISGGWNSTDMSTQTLDTWFDGRNEIGRGINNAASFVTISKVCFARYFTSISMAGTCNNVAVTDCQFTTTNVGISGNSFVSSAPVEGTFSNLKLVGGNAAINVGMNAVVNNVFITSSLGTIIALGTKTGSDITVVNNAANYSPGANADVNNIISVGNTSIGLLVGAGRRLCTVKAILVANNGGNGVSFSTGSSVAQATTWGNLAGMTSTAAGWCVNTVLGEPVRVNITTTLADIAIYSRNDQDSGAFHIYCDGGDIITDDSVVHTAGNSWKFSPTSTLRNSDYPLEIVLARFMVMANNTYNVKAWTRRDNVTTLNAGLFIQGGIVAGIPSQLTDNANGSINTWEQLSLTFTPTETTLVEVCGHVWDGTGTTNNAWFDDLTVNDLPVTMNYTDYRYGPGPQPLLPRNAVY